MKALITGFEPFGGELINPALEAVSRLDRRYGEVEVITASLPVVFHESIGKLNSLMDLHMPDIVLCVGQAGGRSLFSIERVAINIDDARIPDNNGNAPIDEPIVPGGPDAFFSTLPIKRIVDVLKKNGIPSGVSNSAGTDVCNHIMYGLMERISREEKKIRGGFIHVPFAPEQVVDKPGQPYMSVEMMVKALEIIIGVVSKTSEDIRLADDSIC